MEALTNAVLYFKLIFKVIVTKVATYFLPYCDVHLNKTDY